MPVRARNDSIADLPTVRLDSWVFFPVRDKRPLMKRWDRRARSDEDRLAKWWLAYQGCGWGLACEPSGVTVVDVDPRSGGGAESVADLPPTLCAMTPSGGWHLFYQGVVPSSKVGWRKGVDLKGRGGYVVVPSEGDTERWWIDPEAVMAPVPDWMVPRAAEPSPPAPAAQRSGVGGGGVGRGGGYGAAALEGEADRVRETGEGGRNDALYRAAFRMGQLIAQGDVSMTDSEQELGAAAESAGLGSEEAKRTLSNGHRDGASVPRSGYSVGSSGDGGGGSRFFTKKGGLRTAMVTEEVTRDGSGERDVAWGADGVFWQYIGGVWRPWAKHSIIESRLSLLLGDQYRKSQVSSVESYAKSVVPWIEPKPDPDVINFRNGMLDLATGELSEHDRWRFSTVQMAVDYVPGEDTSEFDRFLASVVEPDVIPLVWEVIAYGMYSGNPFEKAVMLVGPERSGKGTTLDVLRTILGSDNTAEFSLQKLASDRFAAASLLSTTANICGDIDPEHIQHVGFLKSLTGGDRISAERKGRDAFGFNPWVTLYFGANKVPTASDVTQAYANRWIVVPYSESYIGREDLTLKKRMASEPVARAVAARAVREFLPPLLERCRFISSESSEDAHENFRASLNSAEGWVAECCEASEKSFWQRQDLYDNYTQWCRDSGHTPMRKNNFSEVLNAHFTKITRRGNVGWLVRVLAPAPYPDE